MSETWNEKKRDWVMRKMLCGRWGLIWNQHTWPKITLCSLSIWKRNTVFLWNSNIFDNSINSIEIKPRGKCSNGCFWSKSETSISVSKISFLKISQELGSLSNVKYRSFLCLNSEALEYEYWNSTSVGPWYWEGYWLFVENQSEYLDSCSLTTS